HAPQLARGELAEAALHLGSGHVLVAGDREGAAGDARRAPGAADLTADAVRRPAEQLIDVGEDLLGPAPAAGEDLPDELGGVGVRHAPAADGVVDDLLQALPRQDDRVERVEQAPEVLAQAGLRRLLGRRGGAGAGRLGRSRTRAPLRLLR